MRRYFIENALQWVDEFRIDALRLDAVHAILDGSARPFLEGLGRAVHRRAETLNRRIHLIAESALNDTRVIRPRELGGFALDAQWNDDFHHSLHTALTGERTGYYRDYGGIADLARAWREGYVYTGQYSPFRQRGSRQQLAQRSGAAIRGLRPESRPGGQPYAGANAWRPWSPSSSRSWPPPWYCSPPLYRCFSWAKNTVKPPPFCIS